MFTKLADTHKAAIFAVLVLCLSVGAALLINFLIQFVLLVLTFALGEEIGMRGYLQPHLMSLGRTRALFVVGLVWATWHMPLYYFMAKLFPVGNVLFFVPLFYGTIVAASFLFGYLRIYTGSTWPASIAH